MALHCFGDSYTEGYKNDMNFWPYDAYRKYLGLEDPKDMPPLWSELLGEKLGIQSFNYGRGGASNQEIFFKFCEKVSEIKKQDIVIINWTYVQRCIWVIDEDHPLDTSNRLTSVSPHQGQHYDRDGLFKDTYSTIAVNRTHFSWTYEILGYQQIIDELSTIKGFKVYYWFTDDFLFNNLKRIEDVNQEKYMIHDLIDNHVDILGKNENRFASTPFEVFKQYGAKTITQDSEGAGSDDMHLGGTGHKIQSQIFYCYLTKNPYPKKLKKYL